MNNKILLKLLILKEKMILSQYNESYSFWNFVCLNYQNSDRCISNEYIILISKCAAAIEKKRYATYDDIPFDQQLKIIDLAIKYSKNSIFS